MIELRRMTESSIILNGAEKAPLEELRALVENYREAAAVRPEDRLRDKWSETGFVFETR